MNGVWSRAFGGVDKLIDSWVKSLGFDGCLNFFFFFFDFELITI